MWLLRYRDPVRYGAWRDDMIARRHPDGAALAFSRALNRLEDDEFENEAGLMPRKHAPLDFFRTISPEERQAEIDEALARRAREAEVRELAEREAEFDRWLAKQTPERVAAHERWEADRAAGRGEGESGGT